MENLNNTPDTEAVNIKELLFRYLMYWKLFVVFVIMSMFVAFIYLRYAKDVFQTTAKIKILDNSKGAMKLPSDITSLFSNSKVNMDNEIEVLKSNRILEQVATNLDLATSYYSKGNVISAELWKAKPFKVTWLDAQGDNTRKRISLSIELQKNGYKIISGDTIRDELFRFGLPNKVNGQPFILTLDNYIVSQKSVKQSFIITRTPLNVIVEQLSDNIKAASTAKTSEVLSLVLNGSNQDKSEAILNSVLDVFNQDGVTDRQLVSQRTIDFVNERFLYLSTELDSIESQKQIFKKNNNLSYLPADAGATIAKKSLAEGTFYNLETQVALAKLLEDTLKKDGAYSLLPSNIGIENESVNSLISDYNIAVLERSKLLISAGALNPVVLEFSQKLVDLKQNILYSINVLQKQLAVSVSNNKSLNQDNSNMFSSIPDKEKKLRSIERQQNIKETLYLFLLQRREEAYVTKAITTPSIKVVDYAITNYSPIAPKRNIIYLAALLLGLLIPFAIVYVIFLLDTKIRGKQDFDRLAPDIPILVEIPFINEEHRIISTNDRSVLAESFRILRTNINYLLPTKKQGECPVIFTTSSIKGEGKTFVSLNLAITLSTMDKKVLLLGADLRNPQLHKYLNISKNRLGLSNYLHEADSDWKKLINENIFDNPFLNIIFAGFVPPNPAELLNNGRFKDLLEILKKEYDYIVVDTAPTILVTDTLLVANLADLTVYITRADYTDKRLVTYSRGLKTQEKVNNIAYVINNVGGEKGYGYGYGYTYTYNYGYGYGYGADDDNVQKSKKSGFVNWFKKLK